VDVERKKSILGGLFGGKSHGKWGRLSASGGSVPHGDYLEVENEDIGPKNV